MSIIRRPFVSFVSDDEYETECDESVSSCDEIIEPMSTFIDDDDEDNDDPECSVVRFVRAEIYEEYITMNLYPCAKLMIIILNFVKRRI